jgi:hypothetical protein
MTEESATATRIVNGVLLITFAEIAIVCAFVGLAAYRNLHPRVRGAIDIAASDRITGWAFDPDTPGDRLEVHLYVDDVFVATQTANLERIDLTARNAANDANHGFSFVAPSLSSGDHAAQVYAVRPSFRGDKLLLPLAPGPVRFGLR